MIFQKFRDFQRVNGMLADAERQGFETLYELEGVEGAERRAEVSQQGHATFKINATFPGQERC